MQYFRNIPSILRCYVGGSQTGAFTLASFFFFEVLNALVNAALFHTTGDDDEDDGAGSSCKSVVALCTIEEATFAQRGNC